MKNRKTVNKTSAEEEKNTGIPYFEWVLFLNLK